MDHEIFQCEKKIWGEFGKNEVRRFMMFAINKTLYNNFKKIIQMHRKKVI